MTFNDACEHIRETANSYGFEVTQDRYSRLPIIRSEELNFFLLEKHDYHHEAREVTTHIQASASVRRMGGNPPSASRSECRTPSCQTSRP